MSRKRASGGKQSKGRQGAKPSTTGKRRGPQAKRLTSTGLVPALVDARIDFLRLVRALDAAGVDAGSHPGLPDALATCAALDGLLTNFILRYDQEPLGEDDPVPEEIEQLLAEHANVAAQVLDVLPGSLRQRVRRERERVGAVKAEIWAEVEALRQAAIEDRPPEASDEELRCLQEDSADDLRCRAYEIPGKERVARHEARDLPDACEAWAWLESLPATWLRAIARLHGLSSKGSKARLATRVEEALLDPEHLAEVLAKAMGSRERAELAGIVADEGVPLTDLTEDTRRGLEVPWDWSRDLPHGVGGRLRAFGLVFVGMEEGECFASVPLELYAPIIAALRRADPKGWRNMDPDTKSYLTYLETGEITDGSDEDDEYVYGWPDEEEEDDDDGLPPAQEDLADGPPVDSDLGRWQKRADEVLDVLVGHFEREPTSQDVMDRLLAPLSAVRPPRQKDIGYLMHLVLFDWRDEEGGRTPAEALLARPGRLGKKRCSVLASRCEERTGLYRVEYGRAGLGVTVTDAFTGGPSRLVDAPDLALRCKEGDLLPARIFRAGPHCLLDLVGEPVDASQADEALSWLHARFREFAKMSGTLDREAFLRTYPECVTLASLLVVDVEEGERREPVDLHLPEPSPASPSRRSPKRKRPEKVYVLDIELVDSEPPVTRRLQVSGRVTLGELHDLLQDVMGWHDEHLHAFEARDGSWRYADPEFSVGLAADETTVRLDEVATRKGSRFYYLYDFGDEWLHEIRVAERLDPKKAGPAPWCLGGQNACPPESSGGVWGYALNLEVLADPDHDEHAFVLEWMGDDFDPSHFDPEEVNRVFRSYHDL